MAGLKFDPGTFLEIDDVAGGRKIVLVCRDGMTYIDSANVDEATPVIIHPVLAPESCGSLAGFAQKHGMLDVLCALVKYLRTVNDQRLYKNPLFVMRVLWFIQQRQGDGARLPSETDWEWACAQAERQEAEVVQLHQYIAQYYANK